MSLLQIAVLAAGLAAAVLAVTMSPQVAHAFPSRAQNCANCHTGSTSTATTATPSTTTPAAGATYTVAITLAANLIGGNSGYAIVPVTAGTGAANGGNTGARGDGNNRVPAVTADQVCREGDRHGVGGAGRRGGGAPVSYTHLRAHETDSYLVCR